MRRTRKQEEGFALLMVFVLAAAIAITLYMEMPRVAFESQRVREQLLIDRGNQYKRAIQLFVRKTKRFPASIDELESFQNVRFLRHKYKDPFTGKDEWRLIHVGPGGVLTDSLVKKPNPLGPNGTQTANGAQGGSQQGTSGQSGFGQGSSGQSSSGQSSFGQTNPGFAPQGGSTGQTGANGQPGPPDPVTGLNMAVARRPSDYSPTGATGQPGMAPPPTDGSDPNQQQVQPQYPVQQFPGQQLPGQQQVQNPYPVQQYPGQQPQAPYLTNVNGQLGIPGQAAMPGQPGQPAVYPGQPGQPVVYPGQPGQPVVYPGQPGQPAAYPGQPGYQPNQLPNPYGQLNPNQAYNPNPGQYGQPGVPGQQPQQLQGGFSNSNNPSNAGQQNPALNAIQQAIMGPRQPPQGMGSGLGGTTTTGGIAGVATTFKGPSIKIVNERKKYQEWEFVYDMSKDKSIMGNAAAQGQAMQNQMNAAGQNNPGFGSNSSSSFGSNSGSFGSTGAGPGAGNSSSFGSGSGAAPPPTTPPNNP